MKVSCIIPAYNEEKRVTAVIDAVLGHELVGEIIVVDDGSTDNTKKVLEGYPTIKVISYLPNRGKSFAVMSGIKKSKNDIIMLLDADLVGLEHKNISDLIQPVMRGQANVSISIRKNALALYKMLGVDFVSGERVFNKKILGDLNKFLQLPKFGLEVFMNNIIIKNRLKIKIVPLNNVSHYRKYEKIGWWRGTKEEIKMVFQIIATVKSFALISQIIRMRSLRIK